MAPVNREVEKEKSAATDPNEVSVSVPATERDTWISIVN